MFKSTERDEPCHEKMCFMQYANNRGADQPAHPRSLSSAFVVCCLDSIIPILVKFKISRLKLVSDTQKDGLSLTSCKPWIRFSREVAQIKEKIHGGYLS